MDLLKKLREPLQAKDIDFRVQSINRGGYATILVYKDARVDMNRLDDVCGLLWQDKYDLIDGQLFCSIGIKVDNEWIWRQDVGTESMTEKEKGRASDSFKRAAFRFGIGRDLYDYPLIQVKLKANEFKLKTVSQGKEIGTATWDLKLKEWVWTINHTDKGIHVIAHDEKGDLRFDSLSKTQPSPKSPTTPQGGNNTESEPTKWLNDTDKQGIPTKAWGLVLKGISDGKVTSVTDVRKRYKVSKEVAAKIEEQLNIKKS